MLVMPAGSVTLVRPLQEWKASLPMLVTPSGIVMIIRLLQPAKAP